MNVSAGPNEKWATDVRKFKIPETGKKLYLSVILSLYDRISVAYVVSRRNNNKLVFDTYAQAIATNPEVRLLFHSDRSFQYTSKAFQKNKPDDSLSFIRLQVLTISYYYSPTDGTLSIVPD